MSTIFCAISAEVMEIASAIIYENCRLLCWTGNFGSPSGLWRSSCGKFTLWIGALTQTNEHASIFRNKSRSVFKNLQLLWEVVKSKWCLFAEAPAWKALKSSFLNIKSCDTTFSSTWSAARKSNLCHDVLQTFFHMTSSSRITQN